MAQNLVGINIDVAPVGVTFHALDRVVIDVLPVLQVGYAQVPQLHHGSAAIAHVVEERLVMTGKAHIATSRRAAQLGRQITMHLVAGAASKIAFPVKRVVGRNSSAMRRGKTAGVAHLQGIGVTPATQLLLARNQHRGIAGNGIDARQVTAPAGLIERVQGELGFLGVQPGTKAQYRQCSECGDAKLIGAMHDPALSIARMRRRGIVAN